MIYKFIFVFLFKLGGTPPNIKKYNNKLLYFFLESAKSKKEKIISFGSVTE